MAEIIEAYDIENPHVPSKISMILDGLPLLSNLCCIFKVPERLRCANEKAYTPQVVSIGPIHHGKQGLEEMEEHKVRYLRYFLVRTGVNLEDYVEIIKGNEDKLRSCYAHSIEMCTDEFVRIVLVDAAFIIEFLWRYGGHTVPDTNDRIFYKPRLIGSVVPDMLLLENQLPFFILDDLFAAAKVPPTMPSLLDISCQFCRESTNFYIPNGRERHSSLKVEHFVDLIRTLHLPTRERKLESRWSRETQAVINMTNLHQAGVKFKARLGEDLFDFRYEDGILGIPFLFISDSTELVLRNLIAFEQCSCDTLYFCDYIVLMNKLVTTPNDVELLHMNGILENSLGEYNEVSTLIKSLGKGVVVDRGFHYATLLRDLEMYYTKPWNRWREKRFTWMVKLRENYLDTPWATISVIAATLIIVLTFIQTVCSFSQCAR